MAAMTVWNTRRKHMLVLTAAGKPVYSRHGNDAEVTAMTSVITAIIGRTLDTADPIRTIRCGKTLFVFALRGPLYFVAVARTGETTHALSEQLRSLHSAILSMLTAKIEQRLLDRPGLDVRPLLHGGYPVLTNLIRWANRSPTMWLDAIPILPLPTAMRTKVTSTLSSVSHRCPGILYSMLVAGYTVVSWSQTRSKEYALRGHDAVLLINQAQANPNMRTADVWTPVCLPTLNAGGFLHAYVAYLGAASVHVPPPPSAPTTAASLLSSALSFITPHAPTTIPRDTPPPPSTTAAAATATTSSRPLPPGDPRHRASMPPSMLTRTLMGPAGGEHGGGTRGQEGLAAPTTAAADAGGARGRDSDEGDGATNTLAGGEVDTASPAAHSTMAEVLSRPHGTVGTTLRTGPQRGRQPRHSSPLPLSTPSSLLLAVAEADEEGRHDDASGGAGEAVATPPCLTLPSGAGVGASLLSPISATESEASPVMPMATSTMAPPPSAVVVEGDGSPTAGGAGSQADVMAGGGMTVMDGSGGGGEEGVFGGDTGIFEAEEEEAEEAEGAGRGSGSMASTGEGSGEECGAVGVGASGGGSDAGPVGDGGGSSGSAAPAPPPPSYHIDTEAPAVFLIMVSAETAVEHVEALAHRKMAVAQQLHDTGCLQVVMKTLAASGPTGVGDFTASAYGIPGLLHFIYVWKPWRQYTMSRFPAVCVEAPQRKALLRAYSILYDRLTVSTPPIRHAVSTFDGVEAIAHVAGIHTTNAILLCCLDSNVPMERVTTHTERLAKLVKRDHDKVLLPVPGTLV